MNHLEEMQSSLFSFLSPHTCHPQAELHVFQNSQPREKSEFLEDNNPVGARPENRSPVHQGFAFVWRLQSSNDVEHRALAAARGSYDAKKFSLVHVKSYVLKRIELPGFSMKVLRNAAEGHLRGVRRNWIS